MTGTAELEELYSAIEESARLLDIACSRERVWPILTAYRDVFDADTVIAFRVATGARHSGELDFRFTVPKTADPYAIALTNGFTGTTDHPIGTLLPDIQARCPIDSYGVDFGVVAGFKKVGPFFPADQLQELSLLADIPSMPRSLADNIGYFTRHGLDDKVSLVGLDFHSRTVNLYFGELSAECLEPETIISMHREAGLPEPSEQLLRLGRKAFGIYATLRWDSPAIERMTFAVMATDPGSLPVQLAPGIEQFVTSAPCAAGSRRFVYAASSAPAGEYYKLQAYYRWQSEMADRMLLSESVSELV